MGRPGDAWLEMMRARGRVCLSEASQRTGIAQSTLRAWVRDGKLAAKKVGGILFVEVGSLDQAAGAEKAS
jgi:transposase-like protein